MVQDELAPLAVLSAPNSLATTPADAAGEARAQLARLAAAIERRVGRQRFDVWFVKSTRLRLSTTGAGESLTIVTPNDFVRDWVNKHFAKAVSEAVGEVMGWSLPVRHEIDARPFEGGESKHGGDPTLFTPAATQEAAPARTVPAGDPFAGRLPIPPVTPAQVGRPAAAPTLTHAQPSTAGGYSRLRHTLDSFVVGAGNEVAYECCRTVAEKPGTAYNPLFIHGPVGLGKTHLLQGLCREYAKLHPTGRWAYLTGEEFTNDFITAVRTNKVDAFRRRMRDLDLLVIDDVHFLGGKRATQEEFLHTFNAVEAMGKHVVIASDAHPKTIASFGESLINRFVSGMVVRVDPPNQQMRQTLLAKLAEREGLEMGEEALAWVARRVTQNVRELEGAMTRIAAHVRLAGRKADVQLASEVLHDLDRQMAQPLRPEPIFESVCEFFGLERRELMSGRRQRTISLARSVAMYLTRKCTNLSYPEIANRMGKRNHSTVISACRRIEAAVERNDPVGWTGSTGDRREPAAELVQRLEEQARVTACR